MIAEPKGEASNRDALSFCVGMYVCMNIRRLCNAILCLCMYIRSTCAIQSYACVCMFVACATIAQFSGQNVPRDNYGPRLLPGLCGLYLMEEHNHKRFKSLPHSLRIVYDFNDALKTHLNVC